MPTSIEQNLTLLLPAHAFLPPELVQLSTSLLAQSRSKAASLKPDEEIARIYACCNIACERLRGKFGLDIAKTNPPTKPRVYSKLYAYLDGALNAAKPSETPQPQRRGWRQLKADRAKHDAQLDIDPRAPIITPTAGSTTAQKSKQQYGVVGPDEELKLPIWVMPMLSQLCRALDAEGAAPHVYAGAQSAIVYERQHDTSSAVSNTPTSKRRRTLHDMPLNDIMTHLPSLLLAIVFHVSNRLQGQRVEHQYEVRRTRGIEAIRTYRASQKSGTTLMLPDHQKTIEAKVDAYVKRCDDLWRGMEWYSNIPATAIAIDEDDKHNHEYGHRVSSDVNIEVPHLDVQDRYSKTLLRQKEERISKIISEDENASAAGLSPALGTMFHPAIDWLSYERRNDYGTWKEKVMQDCAAIRSRVGVDGIELSQTLS
nr:hypothetical protein CFP56_71092 [Quercus suber]